MEKKLKKNTNKSIRKKMVFLKPDQIKEIFRKFLMILYAEASSTKRNLSYLC